MNRATATVTAPFTEEGIQAGTGSYRRANLAFFAAGFVTFITLYNVQPLLPVFAQEFNIPPALASLPLSLTTCTLAATMLLAGTISENLGRKPVMTASLLLTSIISILTSCTHSLHALLALRLLQGIVLAGLPSVAMAYLSEEMAPSSIAGAMGLYISGNAVGGMTGRIFTSLLTEHASWRTAIGVIGALCLLLSLVFTKCLPPSARFRRHPFEVRYLFTSLLGHLKEPGLLCLFGLAFLTMGSFVTLYNYLTFRLLAHPYDLGQTQASLIFLVYLAGSLSSGTVGHLVNRFGKLHMVRLSLTMMVVGGLLTLAHSLPAVILGVAVFTCGFFGAHSIASGWVGRRATIATAQASSLYLFFYYLGSSISGTVGGFCWSAAGWHGVIALICLLLVPAFALTHRLARLSSPR